VLADVTDMHHSSATQKQMNYLKMLLDKYDPSKEAQKMFVTDTLGEAKSVSQLTTSEASKLIKALQATQVPF